MPFPDRDCRLQTARAALLALRHDPLSGENALDPPSAEVCERARWWLVELGFARGTAGGAAISALARRGYAVPAEIDTFAVARTHSTLAPAPLDAPGLIRLAHLVPRGQRFWERVERVATEADLSLLEERRWCSAHELLRFRARLRAEGVPMPIRGRDVPRAQTAFPRGRQAGSADGYSFQRRSDPAHSPRRGSGWRLDGSGDALIAWATLTAIRR